MPLDLSAFATSSMEEVTGVPTGSFLFDYISGVGGLPRGRIVEVFGPESSGKSTILYQCAAQVQRLGGLVLVLDYENSFVGSYGQALGIDVRDTDSFLVTQPASMEEGFSLATRLTEAAGEEGRLLFVIFDSLAAMLPDAEQKRELGANNMAAAHAAKTIKEALTKVVRAVHDSGAVWAFVNHEHPVIQTGFVPHGQRQATTTTPGGKSLKYYASQRYQFGTPRRVKGALTDPVTGKVDDAAHIGNLVRIRCVKNKVGFPYRSIDVLIRLGWGIDRPFSVLDVAKARGVITLSGSTYTFPDGTTARGAAKALDYLRTHPAVCAGLEDDLSRRLEDEWERTYQSLATTVPNDDTDDEVNDDGDTAGNDDGGS